jgi:hypothetical protein
MNRQDAKNAKVFLFSSWRFWRLGGFDIRSSMEQTSVLSILFGITLAACASSSRSGAVGNLAPTGDDAAAVEPAMLGTLYEPGRSFGQSYCSPCHWKGGRHAKQPVAYPAFQVDTYALWATGRTIIPAVLDKWNPDGAVMPPPEAPGFPPDDERMSILDWVRRGSPNTPDGM